MELYEVIQIYMELYKAFAELYAPIKPIVSPLLIKFFDVFIHRSKVQVEFFRTKFANYFCLIFYIN